MDYGQSILVLSSIVFGTILYVLKLIRGPKVRFFNNTVYVDKSKLPILTKFLFGVAVASIPVGYVITRRTPLVLQYTGLNLLIGAIMGSNLILLRERPHNKQ